MIADFGNIKGIAATCADTGDDGLEFIVGDNFFDALFFNIEHLAPQWKNCLIAAVAASLGGTARGVALYNK
jgi:hypothetical protein